MAQILSLRPYPLCFVADFQQNMSGNSININDVSSIAIILKKNSKTSKNCYFGPYFGRKRASKGHAIYCGNFARGDHTPSKTFHFIEILNVLQALSGKACDHMCPRKLNF